MKLGCRRWKFCCRGECFCRHWSYMWADGMDSCLISSNVHVEVVLLSVIMKWTVLPLIWSPVQLLPHLCQSEHLWYLVDRLPGGGGATDLVGAAVLKSFSSDGYCLFSAGPVTLIETETWYWIPGRRFQGQELNLTWKWIDRSGVSVGVRQPVADICEVSAAFLLTEDFPFNGK